MTQNAVNVLLCDDDFEDNFFFDKAINQIPLNTRLTIVRDGEQLMTYLLNTTNALPDVLFLDLSMPRKTGFECLVEMKENERLKNIPVFMLSTSFARDVAYLEEMINRLHSMGAQDYICKPNDFGQLRTIIHQTLTKVVKNDSYMKVE